MSKIIEFLEKLGSESKWRTASNAELECALSETDIEMPIQQAILAKDADLLGALVEHGHLAAIQLIGIQVPSVRVGFVMPSGMAGYLTPTPEPPVQTSPKKTPFIAEQIPSPTLC